MQSCSRILSIKIHVYWILILEIQILPWKNCTHPFRDDLSVCRSSHSYYFVDLYFNFLKNLPASIFLLSIIYSVYCETWYHIFNFKINHTNIYSSFHHIKNTFYLETVNSTRKFCIHRIHHFDNINLIKHHCRFNIYEY